MSKDSKTTTKSLLGEIDRITYLGSIVAIVGLSVGYFWIRSWNLDEHSPLVALREYLLTLIPNLVPVCLIFALSYAVFRRILSIRSKHESDALADNIAHKTQAAVGSDLHIMQQKMSEIIEHADLGRTVHSLGVTGITSYWTDLVQFQESLGMRIKERLLKVEHPATWYIVTMSPEGLMSWLWDIKMAVENRGIDVKWVCHARKSVESDDALKMQWEWLMARLPDWRDRASAEGLDYLETKIKELRHWAKESSLQVHAMDTERQKRAGRWELYEGKVPNFYMAFLSVPGKYEASLKQAPAGTFGFVHLYPMFAHGHDTRPALYLEAPGQILDYYYWSIVQLFDEGIKRGYLWRTWPLETKT